MKLSTILLAAAIPLAFTCGTVLESQRPRQPMYIGGPGGGMITGGTIVIQVPEGTKYIDATVGCPGGTVSQGSAARASMSN